MDDTDIEYIVGVRKTVPADWRAKLASPQSSGHVIAARIELDDLPATSSVRGSLHLYSRQNLNPAVVDDWSVGLVYTDYGGNSYRVIRCNGPHSNLHRNHLEGTSFQGVPHVHRLTNRYLLDSKRNSDGFAEVEPSMMSLHDGIDALSKVANLQVEGALFS